MVQKVNKAKFDEDIGIAVAKINEALMELADKHGIVITAFDYSRKGYIEKPFVTDEGCFGNHDIRNSNNVSITISDRWGEPVEMI